MMVVRLRKEAFGAMFIYKTYVKHGPFFLKHFLKYNLCIRFFLNPTSSGKYLSKVTLQEDHWFEASPDK
jgi:hypothetical protein